MIFNILKSGVGNSDYELPQITPKPRECVCGSYKPKLIRSLKRHCWLQLFLYIVVTLAVIASSLLLFLEGRVKSEQRWSINQKLQDITNLFQFLTPGPPKHIGLHGQTAEGHVGEDFNWGRESVQKLTSFWGYFANTGVGMKGQVQRWSSATLRYHVKKLVEVTELNIQTFNDISFLI